MKTRFPSIFSNGKNSSIAGTMLQRSVLIFVFNLLTLSPAFTTTAFSLTENDKNAKIRITGSIVDSASMQGIEYATITITTPNLATVNMAACDHNGNFSIDIDKRGDLKIIPSCIGYASKEVDFTVAATASEVSVGEIMLSPDGIELAEVVVTGQKPLVRVDPDKLTYSVETDPESRSSSLAEMMRKVPQLEVDADDNVTLNGQSNYKILVNGKNSPMYSNNFKEVIRSMPASSIKEIQVITSPSSKYEAEGVGGIINIITFQRTPNGYNGSLNLSYNTEENYSANVYGAANMGKLTLSGRVIATRMGQFDNLYEENGENYTSESNHYSRSYGRAKDMKGRLLGTMFDASYDIDSLNMISTSFSYYWGRFTGNAQLYGENFDTDHVLTRRFFNDLYIKQIAQGISANVDYQKLFMRPGRTFTVSYKFDSSPQEQVMDNYLTGELNYNSYSQRSSNNWNGQEHTVQLDYFDPIAERHEMEFGAKYILRRNTSDSDIRLLDELTGEWIAQDYRNSDLDHDQHILGIYGGYQYKIGKLRLKGGVRAERTWNDGTAKTLDGNINFTNNLFNVIPYATVAYNLKDNQTLNLVYTQRLLRPSIWQLNPHVRDEDPLNQSKGNPNLDAVTTHSIALNYNLSKPSWNLYLSLSGAIADNIITQVTTIDQNDVRMSSYENIGKEQTYTLSGSYSYRLGAKLNFSINANVRYKKIDDSKNGLKNDGFTYGISPSLNVTVWKGGSVRASGGVYSPGIYLQSKGSTYYYNTIGINQKFFKDKMDVGISVNSPFEKNRHWNETTTDPQFVQRSKGYRQARRFSINAGYRFGKVSTQVKKAKRTINNDDRMKQENSGLGK